MQTEATSRMHDQVSKMISPITRELQENKQQLSKLDEVRQKIEDIQFQLEQTATAEQLQQQMQNFSSFATKRELSWLADIVATKANEEDHKNLKLNFDALD